MKIYAESLFALNLIIDYLLLLATGRICSLRLCRPRMLLGAVWGGVYAVLAAAMPEVFALWTAKLPAGAAAVMLAFAPMHHYARSIVVFFAVSAAFGGAAAALLPHCGAGAQGGIFLPLDLRLLVLSFAVCYAALSLVFRNSAKRARRSIVSATAALLGREISFRALEDTGNELRDPVGGERVLILRRDMAGRLLGGIPEQEEAELFLSLSQRPELRGRLRLLNYSALSGTGLILCFRPDKLSISGEKRQYMIGIGPQELSTDGDYEALV